MSGHELFVGIDLGSTTTKAILVDEQGVVLGRGITNSRNNYQVAASVARTEALADARFGLIERRLGQALPRKRASALRRALHRRFRQEQFLLQLDELSAQAHLEARQGPYAAWAERLTGRLGEIFSEMRRKATDPLAVVPDGRSEFFRDAAMGLYSRLAEQLADPELSFDRLMALFDKSILEVEDRTPELDFRDGLHAAFQDCRALLEPEELPLVEAAVRRADSAEIRIAASVGTGYGRRTLPFPKDEIRSEILCHGLGAHHLFPRTATVLDIGGQDTKAIQVDREGIVTSFQMNDRCAAGCGRYLGYIAEEMSLSVQELGPLALESCRPVKITSTCTVFAGAELRERLGLGQRREDILAGLHRSIILRAMALLARSGGVSEEFTFTGGVANNPAAVRALRQLVEENYGPRTINISPDSIYTGALGAALFALRGAPVAAGPEASR
jgi:benzoyl-CoA reductase subunit A